MTAQLLQPFGGHGAWPGPGGPPQLWASALRQADQLLLTWCLASADADLDGCLQLPPAAAMARRSDGLWQHTCFEAFVAAVDQESYLEVNLSPSGDWNVYGLQGYRRGLAPLAGLTSLPARSNRQPRRLELAVTLPLPPGLAAAPDLAVGLTAVLEALAGGLSYWALHHPAAEPDFHHRGGFTLICPAADRGPH